MRKLNKKIVSIALSLSVIAGLSACDANNGNNATTNVDEQLQEAQAVETVENPEDVLVYGTGDITGTMNPFVIMTDGDIDVAEVTQAKLAYTDRSGDYIMNGTHGESRSYNGIDYTYITPADISMDYAEKGELQYTFTLRSDIVFSDGMPLTADDVIFSMYVLCDPSYDGGNTFATLPIKGLDEYRQGSEPLYELILEKGASNEDFSMYTQAQQDTFFDALPGYGEAYCRYICQRAVDMYGYFIAENDVVSAMYLWGFANLNEDESLTGTGTQMTWTLQGDDFPDYSDFWNEMCATYDSNYQKISDSESLDRTLFSFFDDEFTTTLNVDGSVGNITGIEKLSENAVRVTLKSADPLALSKMAINIAPLHIYGDTAKWSPTQELSPSFGFDKGNVSEILSRNDSVGAGAYVLDDYDGVTAHFHRNDSFYQGAPICEKLDLVAMQGGNEMTSVAAGYPDISRTDAKEDILNPQPGVELSLYDSGEYGYIGINADNVKADKYGGSSSSKALRRAFAVIFASCANNAMTVSGAAGDVYSPIFAFPSDDALSEARELLKTAGYKMEDGKAVKPSDKGKLSYEILVPAGHPAEAVAQSAKTMLESLGIELVITPMDDPARIWGLIKAGNVDMWSGVWPGETNASLYDKYSTDGKYSYLYDVKMSDIDEAIDQASKQPSEELYDKARELIADFAVEIPLFERNSAYIFSSQTVDRSTIPDNMTAHYPLLREVAKIGMQ